MKIVLKKNITKAKNTVKLDFGLPKMKLSAKRSKILRRGNRLKG